MQYMTDTTLVYPPTKNVHTMSNAFTSPSGVENYWKNVEMERISSKAAALISMSKNLVKSQVTNRPRTNGVADDKLIQFMRL